MQFEKFDDKIKQAAEQHHPHYDEKAWAKMEKLLDKHLPVEKDRRRRMLPLLAFLFLAGAGIWLSFDKPWKSRKADSTAEQSGQKQHTKESAPVSASGAGQHVNNKNVASVPDSSTERPGEVAGDHSRPAPSGAAMNTRGNGSAENKTARPVNEQPLTAKNGTAVANHQPVRRAKSTGDAILDITTEPGVTGRDRPVSTTPLAAMKEVEPAHPVVSTSNDKVAKPAAPVQTMVNNDKADNPVTMQAGVTKKETTPPAVPVEQVAVTKANGKSRKNTQAFFVSASLSPDLSYVATGAPGKLEILGGAGLGYRYNRWMIRTGFYGGRKVYSASREQYKPTAPIFNYNYLDKIDANCKVYEIPLNVAYSFGDRNDHSWFASTGLSTLLMKKETYDYLYKYSNGTTYTYRKTVSNENKHYFSILTLSGGYRKKINRVLSVTAEPYLKLPLTGIGFGHVKLSSAGVQLSAVLDLFHPPAKN